MNKLSITLLVLLVISLGYIIYDKYSIGDSKENINSTEKQLYTCGMHPEIITDEPGLCPICEMKLIPLKSSNQSDQEEGIVKIDPTIQQNMNIKTELVKKEILSKTIYTNGILKIAEGNETAVNSRFNGWIEKLFVDETNQFIKKGNPLYTIYSPEIYAASQELLTTINSLNKENNSEEMKSTYEVLKENSIKKLKLLNVPQNEIDKIINDLNIERTITVYSPANGNVIMKNVIEGDNVKEGIKLFHIADLSKLWLTADIYENEMSFISKNGNADISFTGLGISVNSKIDFIDPIIDNATRTIKARFIIDNSNLNLKPDMLADVKIYSSKSYEIIPVDENDIIRSGKNNAVILFLGDGKFKPVSVELGKYFDGKYEIISGLNEGDVIVKSAQFLIDSESRLKSAYQKFSANAGHNHSQMEMTENIQEGEKEEENEYGIESPLIRTGIIDLGSIDINKDGKLFECPMDWNIISDEAGRCPSCEMKLKEYSIQETKDNLIENGYMVKE